MAIELVISEARNSNPVLSIKGFSAKEVYETACRVNAWLERYCSSSWKGYKSPARRDISVQGQFYCPIPLSHNGVTVSVFAIQALLEAMNKAGIKYEYISTHIGYMASPSSPSSTPVSVEVVDDNEAITARPVTQPLQLNGKVATKSELKDHLRSQGKKTTGNKADLLARL